ncbi:MAG TPA: sulfatase-like hydrolase/transferase [Kofleriaceae bacterium]|nr:sulfatase-like hydrolase/transferase [Kofleriaceae bacterium]
MRQLLRRVRWGALVPAGRGWLRLLAAPSSYLLFVALVLTAAAKLSVLVELEGVRAWPLWWIAVTAPDAALCLGLAALFALGERRLPWIMTVTVPLALLVAAVAVVNAAYLGITGEQLSWQVMAVGLDRFGDVTGIVSEQARRLGWGSLLDALILAGAPAGALFLLRRRGHSLHPAADAGARAHAAGLVAGVALVLALAAPGSSTFALQRLSGNAVLRTYWGWLTDDRDARASDVWFDGFTPPGLVDAAGRAALRAGPRPNMVVVVLESVRRDATTLAGAGAPARTPYLAALAARGLEVPGARAVVPHTTKSLFAILCGRLPLMQLALIEAEGPLEIECLPAALAAAGWRTGYFQSSVGVFEDRPRLARRLGFADFAAWEDIGGQPLGYLASDDESLAAPLAAWIDRDRSAPFFAVLLTSSTHHPYRLSRAAEAAGGPSGSPRDRYHRLVEAQDRLLGAVNDLLAERGLAERTIVVALGDHGEGFGEKGIRQHDNNFFDEGLRVPWAMAGPGVPRARVPGDASLVDLAPTLLELAGARVAPATEASTPARSLARGASPGARLLVFSCWFDIRCRGFVGAGKKVVFIPELGRAFWFDLDADPREESPRPLDDDLARHLGRAHLIIDSHRTLEWPRGRAAMNDYPPWTCPAGAPCNHPRSPPGGLFAGD